MIFSIHDTYDQSERYEEAKEYLAEENKNKEKITDKEIWEEVKSEAQEELEIVLDELKPLFINRTCVFADTTNENGKTYTHRGIREFEELLTNTTKEYELIEIYDDNGNLFIRCSQNNKNTTPEHLIQIKVLTNKGEYAYEDWKMKKEKYKKYNKKEFFKLLIKDNKLSDKPKIAEKLYTIKKRKTEE